VDKIVCLASTRVTFERVLVEASGQYPAMLDRVGRVHGLIVLTSVLALAAFRLEYVSAVGPAVRDCVPLIRLGEIIAYSKFEI